MYQYHNYAYSSGVPGGQNVAAYSTRQSAASHNLSCTTASLAADEAGPRRTEDTELMLTSPSCRRPGGASTSYLDRSAADAVPPAPTPAAGARPGPAATYLPLHPPPPASSVRAPLYSTPLDRVAVRVDDDHDEEAQRHHHHHHHHDQQQQQHARSHSAPAATRRRPAAADGSSPDRASWYLDAERRLLPSPPPPPSVSTPTPTTHGVRHLSTLPLNGPLTDRCETPDELSATSRRPNNVGPLPDPSPRRRLRAVRGRCDAGGGGPGSTLAAMAVVAAIALVLSAVSVQLLLRLTTHATETSRVEDSLLRSRSGGTRTVVGEVAVALAAVTVALDLCCLLTVATQCFFAVKLAHCRNADLRLVDVVYVAWRHGWRSGSVFGRINEVTQRCARLVLGMVTVNANGQTTLACNQPPRPTQPPALRGKGNEYRQSAMMLCV